MRNDALTDNPANPDNAVQSGKLPFKQHHPVLHCKLVGLGWVGASALVVIIWAVLGVLNVVDMDSDSPIGPIQFLKIPFRRRVGWVVYPCFTYVPVIEESLEF